MVVHGPLESVDLLCPAQPAPSPHLLELTLADPVSVEDDLGGLEACGLVELDQYLIHHAAQFYNDLLERQ